MLKIFALISLFVKSLIFLIFIEEIISFFSRLKISTKPSFVAKYRFCLSFAMFVTPLDAKKEKVASNSFANKKFELKIKNKCKN